MKLVLMPALALAASAQTPWYFHDNGGGTVDATTWSGNDESISRWVGFSCGPGAPLEFGLGSAPGGSFPWRGRTAFEVDGAQVGVLDLQSPPDASNNIVIPFTSEHLGLAAALMRGNSLVVSSLDDPAATSIPFMLEGSARAIGAALAACGAPALPASAAPALPPGSRTSTDPALDVASLTRAECADDEGEVRFGPGYARRMDLDGDGTNDVVLDFHEVGCSAGVSYYCGSGGCPVHIWLAQPGGLYVEAFSSQIYELTPVPPNEVVLEGHQRGCSDTHTGPCQSHFRVGAAELVLLD